MRNDGTHIPSESETIVNQIHRFGLLLRGKVYTWWNKGKFGKVGKNFFAPGPIHVVNGKNISLGDNVFLGEHCQLYAYPNGRISIGNNCSIDRYVEIRGGNPTIVNDNVRIVKGATIKSTDQSTVIIGSRTIISQGCILDGDIRIGEDVIFGPNVFINESDHGFSRKDIPMNQQSGISGTIVVEDDVWLGYSVAILKNVVVSKGSIIGTNAVVTKTVPPYSINVGIPAKTLKLRD